MKIKTIAPLSTWLAALFFFVILPIFPGCAGGCGEDTSGKGAQQDDAGAPGASAGKSGGGNADLNKNKNLSRYDSGGKSSGTALGQLGEVSAQLTGPVKSVAAEDFKAKVLRPGATVFLTVVRDSCVDCNTVSPVLKALAPQFTGKFEFMQFDGAAVGASGLLPPKLSLEPLPAFVMYKDGKATSMLQGMPFPREVGPDGAYTEELSDYQRRLMRWFHDALTQKNLNFSQTIRKTPAPKN